MIHEIGVELGAALKDKGCPIRVVDGPEVTQQAATGARERIVIEHDGDDKFRAPRGAGVGPSPSYFIRDIGIKITIYSQSSTLGATDWEHRRRAEHVLDLIVVALNSVLAKRRNGYNITGGRFTTPKDLENSAKQPGAVYELNLTVERGIRDIDWKYESAPTAEVGDDFTITNKTEVQYAASDTDPVTGCGT